MQGAVLVNRISDFEVWIAAPRQEGEHHRIEVFSSPAGPASGTLDLDPRAESFQAALAQVDAAFARCEEQARRPGGFIVPQLRQEWDQVRRNEMTVLDAFLEERPAGTSSHASSTSSARSPSSYGCSSEREARDDS